MEKEKIKKCETTKEKIKRNRKKIKIKKRERKKGCNQNRVKVLLLFNCHGDDNTRQLETS